MRGCLGLALALVAATLAAGAPAATGPASDVPADAIAVVGGEPVARATFDQLMRRIRRSYQLQKRTFPAVGTAKYQAVKDEAVALLVWRVTLRQAAAAFGVEVPEATVEARLGQIREQWGGPVSFGRVLARLGLSERLLRDEIRTRLLHQAVRNKLWEGVTVSDEEIASHYARHIGDFVVPENRDVRHILVRTRTRAERLYRQLRAGASFRTLARSQSLDRATRKKGGVLAVYRGRGDAGFERVAFALHTGQLSRPVRTRAGWHVIQALTPIRPAVARPLEDVRTVIRDLIRLAKANALMERWVKDAKAEWAKKTVYALGFGPGGR